MDVPRKTEVDTAAGLAERARQASLSLYLRAAGLNGPSGIDSPTDVCQVLGSLKSLIDNLVGSFPELSVWLEQQLFDGELPECTEDMSYDSVTRSVRDAMAALTRARNVAAQLGRDLELAQAASRGLVTL